MLHGSDAGKLAQGVTLHCHVASEWRSNSPVLEKTEAMRPAAPQLQAPDESYAAQQPMSEQSRFTPII